MRLGRQIAVGERYTIGLFSPTLKTVDGGDLHAVVPQPNRPHAPLKSLDLVSVGSDDADPSVEINLGEGGHQVSGWFQGHAIQ